MRNCILSVEHALLMRTSLLLVVVSLIIIKVFLYLTWSTEFMVLQQHDSWHHLYTGGLGMVLSFLLPLRVSRWVFSIGLALSLDELIIIWQLFGYYTEVRYWNYLTWQFMFIGLFFIIIWKHTRFREPNLSTHQ